MKHLTVRFAWHDNKWDGRICKAPDMNFYCTGNYSLLSPRIQKRIDLEIEKRYKNQKISQVVNEIGYLPPCYWCINALGNEACRIEDPHPFVESRRWGDQFRKDVPPLQEEIKKFSIFSWCFQMSFEKGDSEQNYPPFDVLEKRAKDYINELEKRKSIAFFYANYSNPITGDDYKYLLLGAGLVVDTKEPSHYNIPQEFLDEIRSAPKMKNFPTIAWQFQVMLDPSTTFVLPFHEYLDWVDKKDGVESEEKWKKIDEVSTPILDNSITPHFKYVSMHLSHDKCIYLLYSMRKSIRKMKEQNIVDYSVLDEIEKKIDNLLSIAWTNRGKYPGFKNLLHVLLKQDFDKEHLSGLLSNIEDDVIKSFGSIESYFDYLKNSDSKSSVPNNIEMISKIIRKKQELLEYLSLFDFSIIQFEQVIEIVNKYDISEIKRNPYILFEDYYQGNIYSWNIDETDYNIGLYNIDIAMIPDPEHSYWRFEYHAQSPERIRALVRKILVDAAQQTGDTYLTSSDILRGIAEYPLYYITDKLKIDEQSLSDYEKMSMFKDKFIITRIIKDNQINYQLKEIRVIEEIIEKSINKMLVKQYKVDPEDVDKLLSEDKKTFSKKEINLKEREEMYKNALGKGLFVLTGKAGSGKTQGIVNLITNFLDLKKTPVFVFTPTGKANIVIRKRIEDIGLSDEINKGTIRISTIHRFLYRALWEYKQYTHRLNEIYEITDLVEDILSGKWKLFDDLIKMPEKFKFNPKVMIIDESSMIDEVLFAALLEHINIDNLEHLILVGDERQLPPIGLGRPLVDLIYNLKQSGKEDHIVHLKSNLRFDPNTKLGYFTELFSNEEEPLLEEIKDALNGPFDNFEVHYFSDDDELKYIIHDILNEINKGGSKSSIFDTFANIFERCDPPDLDRVQIITPRRVGKYGSLKINRNIIMNERTQFLPKTKLICEENIYYNIERNKRILGLANGSIGYIKNPRYIHFDEFQEMKKEYKWQATEPFINTVKNEIYSNLKPDKKIDLGYTITVHKSQGSDFNNVLFVLSDITPFITKELQYTAVTRAKDKLHLIVNTELKDNLPTILARICENSAIEPRKTQLFGYKRTPFRPYLISLKNGRTIEVRSKTEYIIANALDKLDVVFDYEPESFYLEYRIKPDFKLSIGDENFYWEHLGLMDQPWYRKRWHFKLEIYKRLGLLDNLITTTEAKTYTNIDENVKKIIDDLKSKTLKETPGDHSNHHYEI